MQQFAETKRIIHNLTSVYKEKRTMSMTIVEALLEEMRKERKIRLVLNDDNIEEYIKLDFQKDLKANEGELSEMDKEMIAKRAQFKIELGQQVSNLKLGYMLNVLKKVFPQKYSMLTAESFNAKLISME